MSTYDVAQICLNGHVINDSSVDYPDSNKDFCPDCGMSTIKACPECKASIQGRLRGSICYDDMKSPAYCHACGKPFPWTKLALESARLIIEEDDQLSDNDKDLLKNSLSDITCDTPATNLAVTRFKRIIGKAAAITADGLRQIVVDIASEAVKKAIFPTGF